jgi:hypothetical protein
METDPEEGRRGMGRESDISHHAKLKVVSPIARVYSLMTKIISNEANISQASIRTTAIKGDQYPEIEIKDTQQPEP